MVRRRARNVKLSAVPAAVIKDGGEPLANGIVMAVLEDQNFASPKRKDCKIDNEGGELVKLMLPKNPNESKSNCKSKSGKQSERGGISGRTIGVPVATRSQTRTIENFFKANTAVRAAKASDYAEKKTNDANTLPELQHNITLSTPPSSPVIAVKEFNGNLDTNIQQNGVAEANVERHGTYQLTPDFIFDLSEDTNDTDNTEVSDEVALGNAVDFATHRSSLRSSHSSRSSTSTSTSTSTTDNIFLQEPVLTLNIDKTPNRASYIKINKSLEIEPIFSSPPTSLTAAALNGQFNKIVSLTGSSILKQDSLGPEIAPLVNGNMLVLPENDNSSCDSGIAFTSSSDNNNSPGTYLSTEIMSGTVQTRRRKPATPHRILCPSPQKIVPRLITPASAVGSASPSGRKSKDHQQLSPRKSPRHIASKVGTTSSKTRRRLNQQKEQTTYQSMMSEVKQNAVEQEDTLVVEYINDVQNDREFENVDDVEFCSLSRENSEAVDIKLSKSAKQHQITDQQQMNQATYTVKYQTKSKSSTGKAHSQSQQTRVQQQQQQQQQQQPKTKRQGTVPLANTNANGNRELTEFFPVRRSVRKTKTAVKEEMMRNLEQAILEERADGLKIAYFEGKGRGIVAERHFQRGEFVVEYVGDLISITEATEREKRYALDENAGCYMYYFKHKNQQYCIDATVDTGKLGRLVNHSRNGNLITKVVVVKQKPHLILIAKDGIEPGEELTYDYGDRSKESLIHHPWLAF